MMTLPRALLVLGALTSIAGAQTTVRVSVDGADQGHPGFADSADVSDDGRYVVFRASASLAPPESGKRNIFCRDLALGTTTTMDVGPGGAPATGDAVRAVLSGTGRFVAMETEAQNLVTPPARGIVLRDRDPDGNGVFDEGNGANVLASRTLTGASPWPPPGAPALSADGRHVAYVSGASDIVPGDGNGTADVFVYDAQTQATVRVSVGTGGVEGNGDSFDPTISGDGRYVAFAGGSTNWGPGITGWYDVFRHDRDPDGNGVFDEGNGVTVVLSTAWDGSGSGGNNSVQPSISNDGDRVAFLSGATNLVPGFIFSDARIFLRIVSAGATQLASVNDSGSSAVTHSYGPSISPDGRYVGFFSGSTNLVANDTNGHDDVFVRDTVAAKTVRASLTDQGAQANGRCNIPALSLGAQTVAFQSEATNLAGTDVNGAVDVYARTGTVPACAQASWHNYGAGKAGTLGVPTLALSADPVLGATVQLLVGSSNPAGGAALLLLGNAATSLPAFGGTVLVQPVTSALLPLPAGGLAVPVTIPADLAVCGAVALVQTLVGDPGASEGIAMSAGLSVALGL